MGDRDNAAERDMVLRALDAARRAADAGVSLAGWAIVCPHDRQVFMRPPEDFDLVAGVLRAETDCPGLHVLMPVFEFTKEGLEGLRDGTLRGSAPLYEGEKP